ncbi:hypothetical protein [Xanthomonas fragariae]
MMDRLVCPARYAHGGTLLVAVQAFDADAHRALHRTFVNRTAAAGGE